MYKKTLPLQKKNTYTSKLKVSESYKKKGLNNRANF